jgi:small-conductance mechanosensitive channel
VSEQRHAITAIQQRATSVPALSRYRQRLLKQATGGLMLLGLVWIVVGTVAFPGAALAQESDDPATTSDTATTSVSVSQEPGICSSQGSFCERLYAWTSNETFAETTAWLVGTPLKIAAVLALAFLANRLARRGIRRTANRLAKVDLPGAFVSGRLADRSRQRADAVGAMLRSGASALIFGIAGIVVLDVIGVSVIPILASLGIVGLAVGFGAQSLIADLISGVMLIIEDQLGVGDRVDVGLVEGVVERVTLRSTVILARNGVRWYVPNSEIKRVANESQHKARTSVQLGVPYSRDLRTVASLLQNAVVEMTEEDIWQEAGVEGIREPFVAELAESAVVLEFRSFIDANHRRPFERALKERLVEVAVVNEVELPNSQVDIHIRDAAS